MDGISTSQKTWRCRERGYRHVRRSSDEEKEDTNKSKNLATRKEDIDRSEDLMMRREDINRSKDLTMRKVDIDSLEDLAMRESGYQ